MSAASQARRRRPEAEVVVLERGTHISYGACGLPYNIEDPARAIEDLVVLTPDHARRQRGIDVRTRHEVESIDTAGHRVGVQDLEAGRRYELSYDALVIATGASPAKPPIPGLDRPGVFVLRELSDGASLKRHLDEVRPQRAVIVGAGYIGMEMSEALRRRGLGVTVLEKLDQVVPGYEPEIAARVLAELERNGVRVETGLAVQAVEAGHGAASLAVRSDRGVFPADLVLVSVGIRPNVALARGAGLRLGETGAIAVDQRQRTSAPDVFAAGDCAEALNLVSGRRVYFPLGTTANKQGKVAGANAAGASESFDGVVGTAAFKLFDLEVGRTGLGLAEARRLGFDALATISRHGSRGHAFPGGGTITTVLVVERDRGRLLGAQMAGGDVVAKRVDVLATALHARMSVEDLEGLDLSYAPPFAPVYDPILVAAQVARKQLRAAAVAAVSSQG